MLVSSHSEKAQLSWKIYQNDNRFPWFWFSERHPHFVKPGYTPGYFYAQSKTEQTSTLHTTMYATCCASVPMCDVCLLVFHCCLVSTIPLYFDCLSPSDSGRTQESIRDYCTTRNTTCCYGKRKDMQHCGLELRRAGKRIRQKIPHCKQTLRRSRPASHEPSI